MLIDAHFHLDLMGNMQALIREFSSADIGIIAVGTTPKAYEREKQFCYVTDNIKVGLGLHPQLVAERISEIDLFLKFIKNSKYIGEIGMDFNSAYITSKEHQLSFFQKIARICADEGDKILLIHSVKAAKAVLDELECAGTFKNNVCILHWFTGNAVERKRAIDAGAWFSINPKMLKTKLGQDAIKSIPADKLLLETDSPFVNKISSVLELESELKKLVIEIEKIRGEDIQGQIERNCDLIWRF